MNNNKSKYVFVIVSVFMQLISIAMSAQTPEKNYIVTETHTDGGSIKSVQYYDALGRPDLLAKGGVNTKGTYVYSKIEYDKLGRESKNWLPVTSSNVTPDFIDSDIYVDLSNSNYGREQYPYSESKYDVIDRILSKSTPGKEWVNNDKKVKTEYITNDDKEKVIEFSLNAQGIPITTSVNYYPKGSLVGVKITDEDNHTIKTFKDIVGNIVLERRNDGRNNIDTYYVYEKGLLRTVIPPLYVSQTKKDNSLLYRYEYDDYGQCVKKTLSGNVVIRYWYDKYGRVAFMQDGLLGRRKYRFYLYDGLNRLAVQGITSDISDKSDCSQYVAKVIYDTQGMSIGGSGYCLENGLEISDADVEIVNYYDGYQCLDKFDAVISQFHIPTSSNVCTTTLKTAQIVKTSSKEKLYRVMFYDEKGRCTNTYSTYLDNMCVNVRTDYSFTDKPTQTTKYFWQGDKLVHTVKSVLSYDESSDLLVSETMTLDNNPSVTLYENKYNDLGQIESVKIGDKNVLSEKYSYDIHGWKKKYEFYNARIHYTPAFSEEMKYADGNIPCYNGNISTIENYRVYDGQAFDYRYDGMDRLVESKFYDPTQRPGSTPVVDYSESFDYNENSAITHICRKGKYYTNSCTIIDDLNFKYSGNTLLRIDDSGRDSYINGAADFHAYEDDREHYSYNGNGAITRDVTKGIANIEYDLSGMPKRIQFRNGSITEYVYTADSVKLMTIHRTAVDGISTWSARELSSAETLSENRTLYVDGFEFENTQDCGKYYYANGYLDCDTYGHYNFNFFAKDHLCNIRAEYDSDGYEHEVRNYYAYGSDMCDLDTRVQQHHKYNGKELDRTHGLDLYDFSARQYDPVIGQFTSMDPLCEKYYHISPYAYCAGNPIKYVDPKGKAVETAWDIANVAIDIASLSDNLENGDVGASIIDGFCLFGDGLAAAVPFIPGGFGSLAKASRTVDNVASTSSTVKHSFQENIRAGKEFEAEVLQRSIDQGLEVYPQVLLVPQNGLGNIAGNRTYVDQLIHNSDDTWTIIEVKLSNHTRLSDGQTAAMKQVLKGNGWFEVRSKSNPYFFQGQQIHVDHWSRLDKFVYEW